MVNTSLFARRRPEPSSSQRNASADSTVAAHPSVSRSVQALMAGYRLAPSVGRRRPSPGSPCTPQPGRSSSRLPEPSGGSARPGRVLGRVCGPCRRPWPSPRLSLPAAARQSRHVQTRQTPPSSRASAWTSGSPRR